MKLKTSLFKLSILSLFCFFSYTANSGCIICDWAQENTGYCNDVPTGGKKCNDDAGGAACKKDATSTTECKSIMG